MDHGQLNEIGKYLAGLMKNKSEKRQIINIKSERGVISTDQEGIINIIKEY